ncbi:MAG: hypothetical protein ACHQFX_09185, partial [Chitinophagales bacterium]
MNQFYTKAASESNLAPGSIPGRSFKSIQIVFITVMLLVSTYVSAQLGVYQFTGPKTCPTQNPNVTTQPANAVFSSFSTVNTKCKNEDNICDHEEWNKTGTIDLTEYHQFGITANAGYALNLTSVSFTHYTEDEGSGNTQWILRSSTDGYASDIATGSVLEATQTASVILPPVTLTSGASVTFRIYIINSKDDGNEWIIDDVTLSGSVVALVLPADPGNPTSDSPQCSNPGVTLTAAGTVPAGETWYWQTSAAGTSTANSGSTYVVTTSGTYYLRSQDNATLAWSSGAGSVTITVTADVTIPVFIPGANSTRCDIAQTLTYTANASNTTGITYSLDAASLAAGNTIDAATGAVTYVAGWTSSSVITASAAGCNGPQTSNHTVTVTANVGTPVFTLGATSSRCQGAGAVIYTATASNATGMTYSLDAASIAGGNTINPASGSVTYAAGWNGTSIITASAAGCNGPQAATHTVTINGLVGTPVFALGATSTRCQGAAVVSYGATATNNTGITYSLNAPA